MKRIQRVKILPIYIEIDAEDDEDADKALEDFWDEINIRQTVDLENIDAYEGLLGRDPSVAVMTLESPGFTEYKKPQEILESAGDA